MVRFVIGVVCLFFISLPLDLAGAEKPWPLEANRILFLGDSITHAGHYITLVETQMRLQGHKRIPEMINLGLPSETCTGLSEPAHPFPRPNVHSRLDAALARIKPDVVFACYGMNDGIYYPFSEERFERYQEGMGRLIEKVRASGAKLVLMTPPPFDPLPLQKKGKLLPADAKEFAWHSIYADYDDVMKKYAAWILDQADRVDMVIDLRKPVLKETRQRRNADPQFTMSPDGVHLDHLGHQILASAILKQLGIGEEVALPRGIAAMAAQRQRLLHDAWLSEVGHDRPGVKDGLPIEEAITQAKELERQIDARISWQSRSKNRDGSTYTLHFPASAKPGELSLFVDYHLWVPDDVKQVRGIIVHQHGCGTGASIGGLTAADDLHWQALATKWNCALLGSSYEARAGASCRLWCDPRNGSEKRFLQALQGFSELTGHPEIRDVPWCLWGHSGGGFWASLMQVSQPERIVAIWLQSGTAFGYWTAGEVETPTIPAAAYKVPVLGCPGIKERDHDRFKNAWNGLHAMMRSYREHGAPFAIAADPRTGHECGDSRYLAIPFFDTCLTQRLPETGNTLRPVDAKAAMLVTVDGSRVLRAQDYQGDRSDMMWLPNDAFVTRWQEFVSEGAVGDESPPGKPDHAAAVADADSVTLTWSAKADFESGIGGFRIQRDGQTLWTVPTEPNSRFGRPLFQTMSYHDTPELPLPELRIVDQDGVAGSVYRIVTINGTGLGSEPLEITAVQLP